MSHLAQAANQFKQEAVPSCFDASRCGINGGTMANADERLILAAFNYDELYNSRSPHI